LYPSRCIEGNIAAGVCSGDDPVPAAGTGPGVLLTLTSGMQCEVLDIEISQIVGGCDCLLGASGSTVTGAITG
jgi:hypothetical protein